MGHPTADAMNSKGGERIHPTAPPIRRTVCCNVAPRSPPNVTEWHSPMDADTFIQRWQGSGGAERANYVSFLTELCRVIGVPEPDPTRPDDTLNAYVFEKTVQDQHEDGKATVRRIDLYRRGHFILEAKQGVEQEAEAEEALLQQARKKPQKKGHGTRGTKGWDAFMRRAREQAERYARLLPAEEGRPPFLLIVDVGHVIEVYAEFTRTGGAYRPFPDARSHRIELQDLQREDVRARLRAIWLDPQSLDPSTRAAAVTNQVALTLANLSRQLERDGHTPERISAFLTRMIFTMFAEDVGLIEGGRFRTALTSLRGRLDAFKPTVEELWSKMATGGYSVALQDRVRHFNGGLFEDVEVLPVTADGLQLLIDAAAHDWSQVEPSIFGTLVERALNPDERHKLGAHYTPRAYVERLVNWTVITPLRDDWKTVQVQVQATLDRGEGSAAAQKKARALVEAFLGKLMHTRVLDPACGTGNFLYVSMELLKALEAEVVEALVGLGGAAPLIGINPEQFLGIEVNPRAMSVAELVLWIGYLQLYAREHGKAAPPEPILRAFHNIEHRDAVLAWEDKRPRVHPDGTPVTRWDGKTTRPHPVTGEPIPDPAATVTDDEYVNPSQAPWPRADFIVGNPPFLGSKRMRDSLGDGYVDALQAAYPDVPQATDFVLRWWDRAAHLTRSGAVRRFGLITTNSITQTYNRRALEPHLTGPQALALVYATPDHPWVDEADGAAVRIAMTVAEAGQKPGVLALVERERTLAGDGQDLVEAFTELPGVIHPDLRVGTNLAEAAELQSNLGLCAVGMKTIGSGFLVTPAEADTLGRGTPDIDARVRPYLNGRDLMARARGMYVIDLYGLSEQQARDEYPALYQQLKNTVYDLRQQNNNRLFRELWWVLGHPRPVFRAFTRGLSRYVVTLETAKHQVFQFMPASVIPDSTIVTFGFDDAYHLGVLQSRVHVAWSLAQGGTLEDRPRYNKTRCFETFPFPDATPEQQAVVRELGERLDAHRRAVLDQHPALTMTGLYNVLAKLRSGEALEARDRTVHDQGQVTILKALHDDLDHAVLAAYGWPAHLEEGEVLARLSELNATRVKEETRGRVRYLRPEYQDPAGTMAEGLDLSPAAVPARAAALPAFPGSLPAQVQAVRQVLIGAGRPLRAAEVTAQFKGGKAEVITDIMDTLVVLGQAQLSTQGDEALYAA